MADKVKNENKFIELVGFVNESVIKKITEMDLDNQQGFDFTLKALALNIHFLLDTIDAKEVSLNLDAGEKMTIKIEENKPDEK